MGKPANTTNLGALSSQVYDLLHDLGPEDRAKVMNSVAQLYANGPSPPNGNGSAGGGVPGHGTSGREPATRHAGTAQEFYVRKEPRNKGEMLAVAARYRELHGKGDLHEAEDFASFFLEARQNFDRRNFHRDMKNAQRQAGLFNVGVAKGRYQLSYYGQQYVDALPDREAVKKLKRPGRRQTSKRKSARKAASR